MWWKEEEIPEEMLRARVVMLYKKGDTSKYENYRPISLLNSLYKIYAAILQKRVSKVIDKHQQPTQYGYLGFYSSYSARQCQLLKGFLKEAPLVLEISPQILR